MSRSITIFLFRSVIPAEAISIWLGLIRFGYEFVVDNKDRCLKTYIKWNCGKLIKSQYTIIYQKQLIIDEPDNMFGIENRAVVFLYDHVFVGDQGEYQKHQVVCLRDKLEGYNVFEIAVQFYLMNLL